MKSKILQQFENASGGSTIQFVTDATYVILYTKRGVIDINLEDRRFTIHDDRNEWSIHNQAKEMQRIGFTKKEDDLLKRLEITLKLCQDWGLKDVGWDEE